MLNVLSINNCVPRLVRCGILVADYFAVDTLLSVRLAARCSLARTVLFTRKRVSVIRLRRVRLFATQTVIFFRLRRKSDSVYFVNIDSVRLREQCCFA